MTVTAYTSSVSETDSTPHTTASGTRTKEGTLACPRTIAFGTKVTIAGKVYTCEDRTSEKYDGRYDIWMATKAEAFEWGKRRVEVLIHTP